ncbi:MAG: alpha-L-rhamnosidase [Chloroflexi bacterium]|nr:alpha-L-rhamnosidase [Chloroflexota bacterium]
MTNNEFSTEARWIWGSDDPSERNLWRYFRRNFSTDQELNRATLLITADSRYECTINGQFIGRGPARGFPFAYGYDVYDITAHLAAGAENAIGVLVNHLNDQTMSYINGKPGFLAELVLEDAAGNITRLASDKQWRTTPALTFNNAAPRISIQHDFEEQYDARQEIAGWDSLGFKGERWPQAAEIGPVGVAPWTGLTRRTIPFLSEDHVAPTEVKAVELARVAPGYFWSLDMRFESGIMQTGLRSAPPGERGALIFTEITAPEDMSIRIRNFPNYETLSLRVNNQVFGANDKLDYSENPIEIHLHAGPNLLMLQNMTTPALLFETTGKLTFSAERFVPGAAWVLIAPLNEINGQLDKAWSVKSLDDLPADLPRLGIPASANKTDIFALTATQEFYAVEGGFCSADITRVTPRPELAGERELPVVQPAALLHDNADWATINPQPDGDVHMLIDFGREIIGYVKFEIEAPEGAVIDTNFFEGIDDAGIFWTWNLRNSFRYVAKEGHQTFTSHYRRGFRYGSFTFRNLDRPLKIRHVGTLLATYPVEAKGRFAASDETLTKIWQVAAYTVQLCMLDTYVDCPAYEQVYWVGDARNSSLVNAVAFGAYDLTDRCVRLTGQSLSEELNKIKPPHLQTMRTHIPTSHVVSGWFDEIPMWSFLWVWMAWENYWHSGSEEALADYYPDVRECLKRCESFLTERDLLDIPDVWNLVDWAAQDLERDGEVISSTALMAQSYDYAARMAETLGLPEEAAAHSALADRLRKAVNTYGWSDRHQGYVDTVRDEAAFNRHRQLSQERGTPVGTFEEFQRKQRVSEPTNTLVLQCNAVPAERREAVMKFVLAAKAGKFIGSSPARASFGSPDEIVPVGSPWFLFFTLETLFNEGLSGEALTILREQWNRMLEKGATTFWETFPGFIGNGHWSRSLCHGWSAAPAYFLSTRVLGVTPAAAGYRRIRIAPEPFHLTWANGTVPTPHGPVSVAWRLKEDGQLDLEYHAPAGCEVEVILPKNN